MPHDPTHIARRTLLGAFPALALLPATAQALTATPRCRVIIDNDFSGDPDGLFQLAHHLLSPSTEIAFIIGSHIHDPEPFDPSKVQADNAARIARDLMDQMRLARRPDVIAGRNAAPAPGAPPEQTPAVRRILAEARRDSKLPLYYVAGAGLTDLAEAIRVDPSIAPRLTLIWIGGPEHPDSRPAVPVQQRQEYNLTIDLPAARFLFNDSALPIWQVPRDIYRTLMISHAELESGLSGAGALGRFLLDHLEKIIRMVPNHLGETYILGDSPLVTLTALQSSFEPDAASSDYLIRPTPRITEKATYEPAPNARPMRLYTSIDTRLTFADMFAKFRAGSL
ncbi:nucleoside hydrolase [Sphingobium sp. BYY-5]|uniref:nucleoside hydrolase n=1 Tax=Sphingobium sp. BYY-5 TaxID=2926400 RepID=UPI001FA6FEA7|nr:nucleoside hydrolase [Sphingobium sp. BYY-5]MCI4589865.1 nucleoside hydrolase [Sphingobium sp. BYY-5]